MGSWVKDTRCKKGRKKTVERVELAKTAGYGGTASHIARSTYLARRLVARSTNVEMENSYCDGLFLL